MLRWRFVSVLLAVALSLSTSSCNSDRSLTDPSGAGSSAGAAPNSSNLLGPPLVEAIVEPLVEPLPIVRDPVLGITGLLKCTPLPYASTTKTIGRGGGTLQIGPHTLTIPAGALNRPVTIRGEAPVGDVNSVKLYPQGLKFAPGREVRLTLSYRNCLGATLLPLKQIVYTTDDLTVIAVLLSIDDVIRRQVSTGLRHFSRYAVAW